MELYKLKSDDGNIVITEMRRTDGYINATKLCKSAGRLLGDYKALKRTKTFLTKLSELLNLSIDKLLIVPPSGSHVGTWIHPLVATNLAIWCSSEFSAKVSIWIEDAKKAIASMNEDWISSIETIKPDKSTEDERKIRDRLANELNASIEVKCSHGYVDVLSSNLIIEIKHASNYKSALGQVLAYSVDYPHHSKRIHLFHENEDELMNILIGARNLYERYNVELSWEITN
jgi:hypothetical protein